MRFSIWMLAVAMSSSIALGAWGASDKPEKEKKPKSDVKWEHGVTPGNAVLLKVNRPVGKFLIYEGTVTRDQRSVNSYSDTTQFYLNVLNVDKRDGMDLVAIHQKQLDRTRTEQLENGKKREITPIPEELQLDLGPNYERVGALNCYAHTPQNGLAYKTDMLLTLKDGSQVRGNTIGETSDTVVFLTDRDKLDIAKSNIVSSSVVEKAHVCIGETPHYLFAMFSQRPVAPGDTWRYRIPVVIPQPVMGQNQILPTQFTATLTGRLREVRSGIATVDYQVSGGFDSGAEEFRSRFPEDFHQNNKVVHEMSGSGVVTLDIEKGRILSKDETFTFHMLGVSLQQGELGKDPKKLENRGEITSKFSMRLVPSGTRLKTNAVVPPYDEDDVAAAAQPDEKENKKKEKEKKKK